MISAYCLDEFKLLPVLKTVVIDCPIILGLILYYEFISSKLVLFGKIFNNKHCY